MSLFFCRLFRHDLAMRNRAALKAGGDVRLPTFKGQSPEPAGSVSRVSRRNRQGQSAESAAARAGPDHSAGMLKLRR